MSEMTRDKEGLGHKIARTISYHTKIHVPPTYEQLAEQVRLTRAKSGRRRKALKALMGAHERLLRQYEIALARNNRLIDELIERAADSQK